MDFSLLKNSFAVIHSRGKSTIPVVDKANFFAKRFSSNSTVDDNIFELPDFPLNTEQAICSINSLPKRLQMQSMNLIKLMPLENRSFPHGNEVVKNGYNELKG